MPIKHFLPEQSTRKVIGKTIGLLVSIRVCIVVQPRLMSTQIIFIISCIQWNLFTTKLKKKKNRPLCLQSICQLSTPDVQHLFSHSLNSQPWTRNGSKIIAPVLQYSSIGMDAKYIKWNAVHNLGFLCHIESLRGNIQRLPWTCVRFPQQKHCLFPNNLKTFAYILEHLFL